MGKKMRIKGDLDDVDALLEIIQILKDVSTNRFFAFSQQKHEFSRFLELFLLFFDLLEMIKTNCVLVRNKNPGTDMIVITSEAGFMSQLNGRVVAAAVREAKKNSDTRIICVGTKAAPKLQALGLNIDKVFPAAGETNRYETALMIRDFVVERVMSGKVGRSICVYTWPKSFNILKPRVVKLLPAVELIGVDDEEGPVDAAQQQTVRRNKDIILESNIDGIMKNLADIWIAARLYEILTETTLAEAASQSQQLESAVESLGSEKKALVVSFKKAGKDELNKSMREVFSASSVIKAGKR
ncbi:MAG: F0F1 ATP synthase subunit gamma [Candidatus Omnitrophica bacterium]|nr:F0F1 ATP synthase subunit gamma [Candidatus Omnitrophota bacterium]